MSANFCRCGNLTESVCPRCGAPVCDRCRAAHVVEHRQPTPDVPKPAA